MNEFFLNLTNSDWIQLFGIVASLIVSIVAIVISILTLKQNSKMIEESTRPVISIYVNSCNSGTQFYYIIIKNFGKSTAYIDELLCDKKLTKKETNMINSDIFSNINGATIAPGQSINCYINVSVLKQNDKTTFKFKIKYHSSTKTYNDFFTLNIEASIPYTDAKVNTENKELKTISYTLQDIVQKHL